MSATECCSVGAGKNQLLRGFRRRSVFDFCNTTVKSGKAQCEHMFSALPLRGDIAQRSRHVGFVPTSDIAF
jgi:hypothetical protein